MAPVPAVAVAAVRTKDLFSELTVQAEFRPYQEVELHAKVAGYLQRIDVDFGDRVKAGDLIAVLEVPELRDELDSAVAAEQSSEAAYKDAHLDNVRLVGVNRSQPNLVAQQDLDAADARDLSAAATVSAARAEVEKYRTLFNYTRITAPFDGVVTARYADPGALIQTANSSQTQSLPLIRLSENQLLRLDFPVSVTYAQDIAAGDPVEIHLEGSDRVLHTSITRFTRRVSTDTRTMETEVEVPNPDLALIPGMYATVVLRLHRHPAALALPVEAVGDASHPTVFLVGPDFRIAQRDVRLGLETPTSYQVLSGLKEGDMVVVGNRSNVSPGEKVRPVTVSTQPTP
jgi:RND family efflux transporter MFP subunit